jgi:uncharacterized Fe-S center protein
MNTEIIKQKLAGLTIYGHWILVVLIISYLSWQIIGEPIINDLKMKEETLIFDISRDNINPFDIARDIKDSKAFMISFEFKDELFIANIKATEEFDERFPLTESFTVLLKKE